MRILLNIRRCSGPEARPFRQTFLCEHDGDATVAAALEALNARDELKDVGGNPAEPVVWERSCLQRRCGACAMLVNGRPRLACHCFFSEFRPGRPVVLEPLSKFPLIRDLRVDRAALFEGAKKMRLWLETPAAPAMPGAEEELRRSARCLMCGCCLEACPNYPAGGRFEGAAGAAAAARLAEQSRGTAHGETLLREYAGRFYSGCGKALACQKVCPAGLPLEALASRLNARIFPRSFRR